MVTYLDRFQSWPQHKQLWFPTVFILGFVVAFYALYPVMGGIVIIFSFVPVAAISWTMGQRAGVIAGTASLFLNYGLLRSVGVDADTLLLRGVLSSLTLIILGALAGWVSQMVEKLHAAAVQLAQDREALRAEMSIRERKECELEAALEDKEVLLKEIHHRVKNNLQIISSLLSLQSGGMTDPKALAQFRDSQSRIRSMALIHEQLYRSEDLSRIDFGTYLQALSEQLTQSYAPPGNGIGLQLNIDSILLDIDTAVPCGLLVSELVSNALKHAFPDGRGGKINIDMTVHDEGRIRLVVRDNGIGISDDLANRKTTSLGLQLVKSLTRQLRGTLQVDSSPETKFSIDFPYVRAQRG
jgi:two-component sensor histidine kinase